MVSKMDVPPIIAEILINNKQGISTVNLAGRIRGVSVRRANFYVRTMESKSFVRLKSDGRWVLTAKGVREFKDNGFKRHSELRQ